MSALDPPTPNRCRVCGQAPVPDGLEYCSQNCYRADSYVCDICDSFTAHPMRHRLAVHPETVDTDSVEEGTDAPYLPPTEDDGPPRPAETPDNVNHSKGPHCTNCGRRLSKAYMRVFGDDAVVNGCAKCRSRTDRY